MARFAFLDDDDDDDSQSSNIVTTPQKSNIATKGTPRSSGGRSRYSISDEELMLDEPRMVDQWRQERAIGDLTEETLLTATHPYSQSANDENGSGSTSSTTPMKTLLRYAHQDARQQKQQQQNTSQSLPSMEEAMQALTLFTTQHQPFSSTLTPVSPPPVPSLPAQYAHVGDMERRAVQQVRKSPVKHQLASVQQSNRQAIQKLLDEQARKVAREQQQAAAAQKAQEEAEERRRVQEEQEQAERERAQAQQAAQEAAEQAEKDRVAGVALAKREEAAKAQAAKEKAAQAATEYLTRADKLVAQLKQLQQSVEPFDKSKPMAKRRLGMKKIVNGKVNTLSEDLDKIRSVASDVAAAITQAKADDVQIEELIKGGNTEYTREMAKGKRYFVDLLCSKVIVRVQAEGFNGQRGDGFPLAHMLAFVAAEHKDVVSVLHAHVFTVCPTAIPRLPKISSGASEEELMDSLGMIKGKDGEYESFERFLGRTEGLISIVADIMSSEPAGHQLFGGQAGAVKWLQRFLSQLPPPPTSPLPLITAPVLDAFITGSGHMLALAYPEEFNKFLTIIEKNVMPRLDEGAVGKPSQTRLQKTLEGGFEGFKAKLPSRAIGELYHATSASGFQRELSSAPKNSDSYKPPKEKKKGGVQQQNSNPFGAPQQQGQGQAAPFGQTSNQQGQSPFGQSGTAAAPSPSPFGGSTAGSNTMSDSMADDNKSAMSFGNMSNAPGPSPFNTFGSSTQNNSPFGGTSNAPAPSSAFGNAAPSPSPFGAPAAAAPSPFGGSGMAPTLSPFGGGGMAPAPSPFGSGNTQSSNSPFGGANTQNTNQGGVIMAPAPSPFGGGQNNAPFGSSFGGNNNGGNGKKPCRFFAQGNCKFGANCKFSHDVAGGGGNAGYSFSNPFGGGPRR